MRIAATATAVLLLAVLSGCTGSPTPTPTDGASGAGSPTPTPTVEPVAAGQPRFDLACEDLLDPAALAPAGPAGPALVPAAVALIGSNWNAQLVQTAGGLDCTWSNDADAANLFTAHIRILPDATVGWAAYLAQVGQPSSPACSASSAVSENGSCAGSELVGEYWVSIEVAGIPSLLEASNPTLDSVPPVADLFSTVTSLVAALPAPSAQAVPPRTVPVPTCDALVTEGQIALAVGVSTATRFEYSDYKSDLTQAARTLVGGLDCAWDAGTPELGVAIETLPGGGWFQGAYATEATAAGISTIAVDGVAGQDAAYQHCPAAGRCYVDLFFGGDLISILAPASGALAVTQSIVANLAAIGND